MATLIPALSNCASRMTSGENRLAQRLEKKLDFFMWRLHQLEFFTPVWYGISKWIHCDLCSKADAKPVKLTLNSKAQCY
ncbi:hypothetical protein CAP37_03915 [Hydrogenophaga sp. IBVHS1]|nr:hypothetical protein CAP37_03915 [Hydrogenophaga sp. IBVHS1]